MEVALFSSALFARRFLNARPLPLPVPDILELANFFRLFFHKKNCVRYF